MRDTYDAMIWNDHHDAFGDTATDANKPTSNTRSNAMNPNLSLRETRIAIIAAFFFSSTTILATIGPIETASSPADQVETREIRTPISIA